MQVIRSLHFGGAEKVVCQLATGLHRGEFEVRVACTHETGLIAARIAEQGIPVSSTRAHSGLGQYLTSWRLWREIRDFRPDVIHTHGVAAMVATGPLAFCGLLPDWVHTFHYGNYPYKSARHMRLERLFARRTPKLVAVADAQRDAIERHHRIPTGRIEVIPNGIPPNEHVNDALGRIAARSEFGLADDDFVVGTVCVMSEQKGVPYLLDAARLALRSHPRMKFLVVGGGKLEAAMRERAAALGLGDSVVFTGWREDVHRLLVAFDVFAMSSLWEAMPLALLEAMAAGRAMVVTDVGDNAKLVGRGECALVVRPRSAVELAEAFARLADDRALCGRLAASALARYQAHYTVDRMLEAYRRLYRNGPPA